MAPMPKRPAEAAAVSAVLEEFHVNMEQTGRAWKLDKRFPSTDLGVDNRMRFILKNKLTSGAKG